MAPLLQVAASEAARIWSESVFRAEADVPAWVTDGNAQLLGTAALLRLGLIPQAEAARRVNAAFNSCFALARIDPASAAARPESTPIPSACGLAIEFVLVALAQRADPALDAFAFWRGFWKAHPRYGVRSIVDYIAALAPADADFAASLVGAAPAAVDAMLARGLRSALALELPPAPPEVHASLALNNLMLHDCGGRAGFWTNQDHLFTDEVPGCRFFKGGWKVRYLARRDLLRSPAAAIRAAKAGCVRTATLVLGTLDDREYEMPCDAAVASVLPEDLRVANLPPLRVARVLVRQ
jgi:hypothetical protein